MRLWSLSPKYLDRQGLTACWREALLAKKVLQGKTKGYKKHPRLNRFREHPKPIAAINTYLYHLWRESLARSYNFDRRKIGKSLTKRKIPVTTGQLKYELGRLRKKLGERCPHACKKLPKGIPDAMPLFVERAGKTECWEKQ